MKATKAKLTLLREGEIVPVDPRDLDHYQWSHPLPEERAVLMLAAALNRAGERRAPGSYLFGGGASWECLEKAAAFYNQHGLARTLDEIVRLDGPEALEES